jgi:chemotaxis-related protein WspD
MTNNNGATGWRLLERDVPTDYIQEWTTTFAEQGSALSTRSTEEMRSLIGFMLGNEFFALSVRSLQEVIHPTRIHPLPRRSDRLFLGLTNVRGEILLCASLQELLGLDASPCERMLIVGTAQQRWVFPVTQVDGIHRYPVREIQAPPAVVTKTQAYTQGIVTWNDRKISYLNAEQIIEQLERRIL